MDIRIAELRKRAGLSQKELAAKIGATLSMTGKLERGERELNSTWLMKISQALNVHPTQLFLDFEPVNAAGCVSVKSEVEVNERFLSPAEYLASRETGQRLDKQSIVVDVPFTFTVPVGAVLSFYSAGSEEIDMISSLCLVKRAGENRLIIAVVLKGSLPNRYHLLPPAAPMMEDAQIEWACEISTIELP